MNERDMLVIDGSLGEGGGAILRLSVAYSVLYNQPIKIINIRANRPKPGLRHQHLLGIRSLAELTGSQLSDCDVGTTEITFVPKREIKSFIHVNVITAASIGLLMQPIQIGCLGFNEVDKVEIKFDGGGTFGKWAPSVNYLQRVSYPLFKKLGLDIETFIDKHGWYPKGGAKGKYIIHPPKNKIQSIKMEELGKVKLIQGDIMITHQLKRNRDNIAQRIRKAAEKQLKKELEIDIDINETWVDSSSPGVGLNLWSLSDNGSLISSGTILGEKRISSEQLGKIAANEILKYIKKDVPIDNYLSDQLIPIIAFSEGNSIIKLHEITSHARTNLQIITKFSNRNYQIIKNEDKTITLEFE